MDDSGQVALLTTAAFVGLVHTVTGPDHYLPFVAMSQAGNWSLRKSLVVTAFCGVGHVASSVVLGMAGLLLGAALSGMVAMEESRGQVAGWLLLGFGLAYMIWGLRTVIRGRSHENLERHADGSVPSHPHAHRGDHLHAHSAASGSVVTPWLLFLIFVFGPCEPLIPLLMYPAATSGLLASLLTAAVFALTTIGTMLFVVTLGCLGISRISNRFTGSYAHLTCGAAIAACGAAVCLGL